jgi:hypothetical protein
VYGVAGRPAPQISDPRQRWLLGLGGERRGEVCDERRSVKALSQSRSFVTAETSDPAGFIDGQLQLARTKGFVTSASGAPAAARARLIGQTG